jgi:hypothetical protein
MPLIYLQSSSCALKLPFNLHVEEISIGFCVVLRIRSRSDPKFLPDLESDLEKIIPDSGSPDPE